MDDAKTIEVSVRVEANAASYTTTVSLDADPRSVFNALCGVLDDAARPTKARTLAGRPYPKCQHEGCGRNAHPKVKEGHFCLTHARDHGVAPRCQHPGCTRFTDGFSTSCILHNPHSGSLRKETT